MMCRIISLATILESKDNFIETINDGWFGNISSFFDSIGTWFGFIVLIISIITVILWRISYVKKMKEIYKIFLKTVAFYH